MNLADFDKNEDKLIEEFLNHDIFKNIEEMNKRDFFRILIQKRFHSHVFTPLYDMAIDGLENKEAIKICREILREEYPPGPSHREDLVYDMMKIGISKQTILKSEPTKQTLKSIESLFKMLKMTDNMHEIKMITILRFWGEILVAEEYGKFIPFLEKSGLNKNNSRFYWPHYEHDKKISGLNDSSNEKSHSDQLTDVLKKLLNSEEKIKYCTDIEKQLLKIRMKFYDQF